MNQSPIFLPELNWLDPGLGLKFGKLQVIEYFQTLWSKIRGNFDLVSFMVPWYLVLIIVIGTSTGWFGNPLKFWHQPLVNICVPLLYTAYIIIIHKQKIKKIIYVKKNFKQKKETKNKAFQSIIKTLLYDKSFARYHKNKFSIFSDQSS